VGGNVEDWRKEEKMNDIYNAAISKPSPPIIVSRCCPTGCAGTPQPPPSPGNRDVADCVLADIQARIALGQERYGTKLQTHNGRDALWDAYQEAIDLVMYLRQAILERDEEQMSKAAKERG
jgi:hypothetical protein